MNASEIAAPWLKVAADDIASIRNNLYGPVPNLEFASYHCQQVAEKTIKAVLVAEQIRFGKIHNLERLVPLLPDGHILMADLNRLDFLSPYIYAFRYRPEVIEDMQELDVPSRAQHESWLAQFETLLQRIQDYFRNK